MGTTVPELDPLVVILAGGRGSRSSNPSIPKILQELGGGQTLGGSILDNLARNGFSDVHLLLGHLSELVIPRVPSWSEEYEVNISWSVESTPRGTAREVIALAKNFANRDIIVILGDTYTEAPLKPVYEHWLRSGARFGLGTHISRHRDDSDLISINALGFVQDFRLKGLENPRPGQVYSITTLAITNSRALTNLKVTASDFFHTVLHQSISEPVAALRIPGVSMDTGTPDRLEKAQGLYGRTRSNFADFTIFVDRDGTLISDTGSGRKAVEEGDLLGPVVELLRIASRHEVRIFIVSNQPGIAKGQITFDDVARVFSRLEWMLAIEGVSIHDIAFCPHHPERGHSGEVVELKVKCSCRKPSPGLATGLLEKWRLETSSDRCLVIGDSDADRGLADSLGCGFVKVESGIDSIRIAEIPQSFLSMWDMEEETS